MAVLNKIEAGYYEVCSVNGLIGHFTKEYVKSNRLNGLGHVPGRYEWVFWPEDEEKFYGTEKSFDKFYQVKEYVKTLS